MAAEKLRDLSQPIDVGLLDATVEAFYGTGSKEEVRWCIQTLFSYYVIALFTVTDICNVYDSMMKLNMIDGVSIRV